MISVLRDWQSKSSAEVRSMFDTFFRFPPLQDVMVIRENRKYSNNQYTIDMLAEKIANTIIKGNWSRVVVGI